MTGLNYFKSFSYILIFAKLLLFLITELKAEDANNVQVCIRNPPRGAIISGDTATFSDFISAALIYIDKTALIAAFVRDKLMEQKVHVITFPRRSGKSLNLLMIRYFFEIELYPNGSRVPQHATRSYHFFKSGIVLNESYEVIGTFAPPPLISNPIYEEIVRSHLAQYPVIYVEFKGLDVSPVYTLELFLYRFRSKIAKVFETHEYLLNDFNEEQSRKFNDILEKEPPEYDDLLKSIGFLSKALYEKFSKYVIIIIDEYDVILSRLYLQGTTFNDPNVKMEVEMFYSSFLKNILLDSGAYYVQCFMTGVMKLQNAGLVSSDLNFLQYYTSSTSKINKYYGISRREAAMVFDFFNLTREKRTEIEKFYDGYVYPTGFREYEHYYNVISLLNYFHELPWSPSPRGYWTGSGSIPDNFQRLMMAPCMRDRLRDILLTDDTCLESYRIGLADHLTFTHDDLETLEDMLKNPESAKEIHLVCLLPRFLLATGYLTLNSRPQRSSTCLKYPNEEVKYVMAHILTKLYESIFTSEYRPLVETFDDFLFDNKTQSIEFEEAFEEFVVANKEHLIALDGRTEQASAISFEVDEAFFVKILGFAMIGTVAYRSATNQFRRIGFEEITEQGKIDAYVHNGKRQAIVEVEYEPTTVNITKSIAHAQKYQKEYNYYPSKFIRILGYANGSIKTTATFDWSVPEKQT